MVQLSKSDVKIYNFYNFFLDWHSFIDWRRFLLLFILKKIINIL